MIYLNTSLPQIYKTNIPKWSPLMRENPMRYISGGGSQMIIGCKCTLGKWRRSITKGGMEWKRRIKLHHPKGGNFTPAPQFPVPTPKMAVACINGIQCQVSLIFCVPLPSLCPTGSWSDSKPFPDSLQSLASSPIWEQAKQLSKLIIAVFLPTLTCSY